MAHSPGIRHYNTHAQLVEPAAASPKRHFPRFPDVIVVPAAREASNLKHVIALAHKAKCRLAIICSREADSSAVQHMLTDLSFTSALVIDLPHGYTHPLFEFGTTSFGDVGVSFSRDSDLSMKRNLALVLARCLGWRSLFFMDDDIRNVKPTDLHRTVALLESYPVAGMRVKEFPDNSVACLANRLTGSPQDVFISGSVLAVDCSVPLPFFPDIYNEDWFFFYEDVADGRLGRSGGFATQVAYDPFADPLRAARQEFGDLLAEGLYAFLHDTKHITKVGIDDWAKFHRARESFLEDIRTRATDNSVRRLSTERRERIISSVETALKCLAEITPEICDDYVQCWRSDLNAWEKRIGSLSVMSQDEALTMLRLSAHARALGECGGVRAPRNLEPRGLWMAAAPAVAGALLPLVIRSKVSLDSVLRMRKPGTAGLPVVRGIGAVGDSAGSSWPDPGEAHGAQLAGDAADVEPR